MQSASSSRNFSLFLTAFPHWIERFHSRGQQLGKFLGTTESFYMRKEFNPHRNSFCTPTWRTWRLMKTLFRRILHHKIIYVLLDSESKFSPLLSEGGRGGGVHLTEQWQGNKLESLPNGPIKVGMIKLLKTQLLTRSFDFNRIPRTCERISCEQVARI